MARYIDADALIEAMTEVYKKHYAGDVSASGFTIAMEMVRKQPTAYDVEKVVEELEKGLKNLEHNKKLFEDNQAERGVFMCDSEITAFKMAIGIVKRGGTE